MAKVPKILGWPLVAATGYGIFYFMANRAVYYPFKYPEGIWQLQDHFGAGDTWLRASDGVRLHGWWIPVPGARIATLYLHGNAGNITHRGDHIRAITAAGSSLLIIDYRGYGKSEGRPSERGLYADAEAAWKHLVESGHSADGIVVHGESLGTAVAVDLASRHPCGGVVLEAPFTSARDVAGRVLPVLGPLVVWGFDSKRKIPAVRAPVLIIHGDRDEVIDHELGQELFDAAREPKSFWAVRGAGHNNIVETAGPQYIERLREFYAKIR